MIQQPADKSHPGTAARSRMGRCQQQGHQSDKEQRPPAGVSGHGQGEEAGGGNSGKEQPPLAVNPGEAVHRF